MKDVQISLLDLLYPKFIKANDKSQDSIIKLPYSLPINSYVYNIFFIYHRNIWHYESG